MNNFGEQNAKLFLKINGIRSVINFVKYAFQVQLELKFNTKKTEWTNCPICYIKSIGKK